MADQLRQNAERDHGITISTSKFIKNMLRQTIKARFEAADELADILRKHLVDQPK